MTPAQEMAEVQAMASAGLGQTLVEVLKHTSTVTGWPATMPAGWIFTSKPTRHGDRLTVIIARDTSTNLYHSHLFRFDVRQPDGSVREVDLRAYLNKHPNLTAHRAHIYPSGKAGGILCLSERTLGGMPDIKSSVLQSAKWADGIGLVVRGKSFPYRQ